MSESLLVTGGAGFIGANFVLDWLAFERAPIVNLDKLTYAGNLHSLASVMPDPRHTFVQGDINDRDLVRQLLQTHRPRVIMHFAAESHVDRSIQGPIDFVQTNIVGTFNLLQEALGYWMAQSDEDRACFRFVNVSTDEVFGSLNPHAPAFVESSSYEPNSPYSASKAAADHMTRAFCHTYGLPTLTTHCSNNYGPYQFPEKLIPLMISRAVKGESLPVYGDGQNIRDWLYVGDHCSALRMLVKCGVPGETYNIGGRREMSNVAVVHSICDVLDRERPRADGRSYRAQIAFVPDRPGHDRRYAIDASKLERATGWRPVESFDTGLQRTVEWYLANEDWVASAGSGVSRNRGEQRNDGSTGGRQ
jgi:dTDP-glucose 4,6-dehydratase